IKSGRGSRVDGVEIEIACDVDNPLTGPRGAAHVYGPQKGASPADVERLDAMLGRLVDRLHWRDHADAPGGGAAGGIGVALAAMFKARLSPGFDLVAKATKLADRIVQADLVITGEGSLDSQTAHGKAPAGVARLVAAAGKRCVAIAGRIEGTPVGFARVASLVGDGVDEATAMRDAAPSSTSNTRGRRPTSSLSSTRRCRTGPACTRTSSSTASRSSSSSAAS
ncbi:glycerate kinase, partial [bacterium]